jgi:hypothetical protein
MDSNTRSSEMQDKNFTFFYATTQQKEFDGTFVFNVRCNDAFYAEVISESDIDELAYIKYADGTCAHTDENDCVQELINELAAIEGKLRADSEAYCDGDITLEQSIACGKEVDDMRKAMQEKWEC